MQKKVLGLSLISAIMILVSCASPPSNQTVPDDNSSSQVLPAKSKVKDGLAVKSETEIKQDLLGRKDFFALFDNDCYDEYGNFICAYDIDKISVTRRKTDDESGIDNVYITAVSSNGQSQFTGNYHLTYTLYDVGGWYLDEIDLESGAFEPLSGISEEYVISLATQLLEVLGADDSNLEIIDEINPTPMKETFVVQVEFNDGILAVTGDITLNFDHDGTNWYYTDYDSNLFYDILIDGTYENRKDIGTYGNYPNYLTITHETGTLEIWLATGWGGGIDPFYLVDWPFHVFTRSLAPSENNQYFFEYDGTISHYIGSDKWGAFIRIGDPITDVDELMEYLQQKG